MKVKKIIMRVTDVLMLAAMLLLMAMQVTQQEIHEWLGIGMFALVIAHHILNRKYYTSLFKGKYTPLRVFMLTVNTLLLLSFIATPTTGMLMSRYATPFLNGIVGVIWPRKLHLTLTYWSFVLMGLHAGFHFGIVTAKLKSKAVRITAFILMCGAAGVGFWLFIKANILDYMLMKTHFAFTDCSKPWWLTLLENLAMLFAWAFMAYLFELVLNKVNRKQRK